MAGYKPLFIRSVQSSDIPFSKEMARHGEVGFLYSRAYDSFVHDTEGQDYFLVHDGDSKLCFVLCDGVGQSYCGQLAARFLGEYLFSWLQNLEVASIYDADLGTRLTHDINALAGDAQSMVIQHELPENMPDLLKLALTEQKNYGSEAVFVAGRIDFQLRTVPPLLNLFWLGDTSIHLFDKHGSPIDVEIPGKWINAERWSTKHGIKGTETVNHWLAKLQRTKRIIVHSDGFKVNAQEQLLLMDNADQMNLTIDNLRSSAGSDDVSLVSFDFSRRDKRSLFSANPKIIDILNRVKYGIFRRKSIPR